MTKIETERLILREMTPEDFDTELQLKSLKKILIGVQYECILRSIEDELLPPQPPPFLDKLLPLHTIGVRPRANAKNPGASVSRAPRGFPMHRPKEGTA